MKKLWMVVILSVCTTLSFASNNCIENIEKHVKKERSGKRFPYELHLRMAACNLRDQDMSTIVAFLQTHKDIYHLDLSDNLITSDGAQILVDGALEISSLALDNNDLGEAGARVLSQFKANPVSWYGTSLSLGRNNIRDAGAMALAENTTFSYLNLGKNYIGDAGIMALAHNTSISSMLLNYNQITNTGVLAFAQTTRLVRTNQIIQRLELGWNRIGATGEKELIDLQKNRYIANLFLKGNIE